MKEIVQVNEDAVLREKATPVPIKEITSEEIKSVITDMQEALALQEDGVAIAAPQIGIPLRIFVVSKKAIAIEKHGEHHGEDIHTFSDQVFINPVITKLSQKKVTLDEGCLSVRGVYGKIKRAEKATVRAYDENGKPFTRGGSGLMAQIFQHETDHLDGVLFIDNATDLETVDM